MAPKPLRIMHAEVLCELGSHFTVRLLTTSGEMDVGMTAGQYRSVRNQLADTGSAVLDSGADK